MKWITPDDEAWNAFSSKLKLKRLREGEVYLKEGEVCRKVAFIVTGSFRMFYTMSGEEFCKDFQFEGQFSGSLYSLLSENPSRFSIAALEDTQLFEISRDQLFGLYDQYRVWERFGRVYMEHLFMYKENREASLLFETSTTRYEKMFREQPDHLRRIPLKYLASYLGMKPESLSRIRKKLSEHAS